MKTIELNSEKFIKHEFDGETSMFYYNEVGTFTKIHILYMDLFKEEITFFLWEGFVDETKEELAPLLSMTPYHFYNLNVKIVEIIPYISKEYSNSISFSTNDIDNISVKGNVIRVMLNI